MKHRMIVFGAAGALALVVAVGAWASQEPVNSLDSQIAEITETVEPEPTGTSEPDATATAEPEATPTGEPEATATSEPEATSTSEPEPTETPVAEPTEPAEEEDDGVGGIPADHPVFTEDTDGVCDEHETRIMTTPSGKQVRVPCHVSGADGGGNGNGEGEVEPASESPNSNGNGNANQQRGPKKRN